MRVTWIVATCLAAFVVGCRSVDNAHGLIAPDLTTEVGEIALWLRRSNEARFLDAEKFAKTWSSCSPQPVEEMERRRFIWSCSGAMLLEGDRIALFELGEVKVATRPTVMRVFTAESRFVWIVKRDDSQALLDLFAGRSDR